MEREAERASTVYGTSTNPLENKRLGRKTLSLDERFFVYHEVPELRKQSLSYREMRAKIAERHGLAPCKETISNWVRGLRSPYNSGHPFIPKPTPELAYTIGVKAGDASLNTKLGTYQYRVRLQAVDRDFAEVFNKGVATVLMRPPHRLWKGDTARKTHFEFSS